MKYPVDKVRVTSPYGNRGTSWHYGLDFGSEHYKDGDNIYSVLNGIVKVSKYNAGGYGHYVVIQHDGFCSVYAHLLKRLVKVGQKVSEGQIIALMGHSPISRKLGTHLHFEIRKGKYDSNFWKKTTIRGKRTPIQCVNPVPYFREKPGINYKALYEEAQAKLKAIKEII